MTGLGVRISRVLFVGGCLACVSAFASEVFVTTPGGLGANDSTNWSQLGGDQTALPGPFSAISARSIGVTGNFSATDNTGLVAVVCPASPSCTWGPVSVGMVAGDSNIWAFDNATGLGTGPIDLSLAKAVLGGGAWLAADTLGVYTASIQAFDGASPIAPAFTETSDSSGDPIFLGLLDSTADITRIEFSLTRCGGCSNNGDLVIDTLLMTDAVSATPEPSTLLLFGSGLAGMVWTRRRKSWKNGRKS
jgi:PEP-CTERM motif